MSRQTTVDGKCVVVHPSQEYDYYVGRGTPWGNPFSSNPASAADYVVHDKQTAVQLYMNHFRTNYELQLMAIELLTGKRIACYCGEPPCHAQFLADFVNNYQEAIE